MFGAVLQGSLFGLVGKFPPKYSSWFMSGQAMAGIFSAAAMLMSKICEYQWAPIAQYEFIFHSKRLMCYCGSLMKVAFDRVCFVSLAKTDNESAALGYFITPCAATLLTLCCYSVLPHLVHSFIMAFLVHKNTQCYKTVVVKIGSGDPRSLWSIARDSVRLPRSAVTWKKLTGE